MVVETIVGCVTVCFVASLRFAKWAIDRRDEIDGQPRTFEQQRKLLVKQRDRVLGSITDRTTLGHDNKARSEAERIDAELIALDREEREIWNRSRAVVSETK